MLAETFGKCGGGTWRQPSPRITRGQRRRVARLGDRCQISGRWPPDHDAQMIARIAPAAMIFVPSIGGISHNPKESTPDADLIAGANMLLDVVRQLAAKAH
ncbi:M20/M25/M40 family metallo-hydrolase (plasmid) [Rhizobium sp. CB3090]|uniref:M20/M25/M40 family metallo-hydrolase n=1 Tax=Rhizobium sp. CB3090 TaxID=3039156 RepID=UPI0024B24797|nr:M20/M25/M40 family metallo-hydrolase [Rhizobium sp. CB3090]WFU11939.1 M20/M25/M40 family metallo-hydrolase [Rhizobium sp. CB3090]